MEKQLANNLLKFLYESPTAYHAVDNVADILKDKGFKEIREDEAWKLKKGDKYYVIKDNSAIIAFQVGDENIQDFGYRLIGSHTDSPGFRVKPNPEIAVEGKYLKLNTEVYGGPILNTWFDRPLALAGRVVVKGKTPFKPEVKLININKPLLIIPNVAIHMNRSINEGCAINPQKDTLPMLAMLNEGLEKDNFLLNLIVNELEISKEDIITFDLSLYEYEKGTLLGVNEEFISSGRLDDLWMVYASVEALINSKDINSTKVMVAVDSEEIGSRTAQGANSMILNNLLERISLGLGKNKEEYYRALSNSVMISSDLAHAVHPNAADKHDPTSRPVLEGGPVLKSAASGSYSTDSINGAIFEEICKTASIPYQKFVNRSDVKGGSTIGPITASFLNIPVIDMGAPLLGMHSIRELGTVKDNYYTVKLFTEFYSV